MAGFQVLATNHTSFTVSDLDRSIGFFTNALGFELLNRAPRDPTAIQQITGVPGAEMEVAFVQGPGHRIELIQYLAPADKGKVAARPCDTGFAHIAYDVDNIDAAIDAAMAYDVQPIGAPYVIDQGPNTGNRVAYLRDPDGITVEFIEKKPA